MAGPVNAVPLSESLWRVTSQSETERGMHAYKNFLIGSAAPGAAKVTKESMPRCSM